MDSATHQLVQAFRDRPTTLADALRGAQTRADLRAAFEEIDPSFNNAFNSKKIGQWFKTHTGRILNGMRIVRCGNSTTKVALWAVVGARPTP